MYASWAIAERKVGFAAENCHIFTYFDTTRKNVSGACESMRLGHLRSAGRTWVTFMALRAQLPTLINRVSIKSAYGHETPLSAVKKLLDILVLPFVPGLSTNCR